MELDKEKLENQGIVEGNKNINSLEASTLLTTFGKFQVYSLALLIPTSFYLGIYITSPVLLNITPEHRCRQTFQNNTFDLERKSNEPLNFICNSSITSHCFRCQDLSYSNNGNQTLGEEDCIDGWIYDDTFGNTVVSEFDIVCKSAWKKPVIVASFMAGMMIGSPLGGRLSDRFGRKTVTIVCCFLLSISTIVASFSPTYWFYVVLTFFEGIFQVLVYLCSFVWVQEIFSGSNKRTVAAFCMNFTYACGNMFSSLFGYLIKDWNWICRGLGIIAFFNCFLLMVTSESPIWLLHSKKKKEALQTLNRVVKWNKVEVNKQDLETILETKLSRKDQNGNFEAISSSVLWRNKVFLKRLFIICYLWTSIFLGYFTMIYNVSNLGGNVYYNNVIGGVMDIGAAVLMTVLLKRFSQKNTLLFLYTNFGFISFLFPSIKQVNSVAGIVCAMLGRFFATAGLLLTIFYTGEVFPTLLRNTVFGIASMVCRVGSILAPFLIFAGEEVNFSIPFYVMGSASFFGMFLSLFLPHVSKTLLVDTVEDALALKRETRCFRSKHKTDCIREV